MSRSCNHKSTVYYSRERPQILLHHDTVPEKSTWYLSAHQTVLLHLVPQGASLQPSTEHRNAHWMNNSMNKNQLKPKRIFTGSHDLKVSGYWLQAWLYPAAQMMSSHSTYLLTQLSSVWVGFVFSQGSPLAAPFHQHGNSQGKKTPLSQ